MMGSVCSERESERDRFDDYYVENTVFVAVGKHLKESESVLSWTAKKFARKKRICILHVHQPAHLVTFFDGKITTSKLKQRAIKAFRELDKQKLHKLVHGYVLLLSKSGVHAADRMWIEMDNIEEGILKLIVQHGIKWLVMGAAADKQYTKEMTELESQKAIFVCERAPVSCHIWFVCRGNLIYTRDGRKNDPGVEVSPSPEPVDSSLAIDKSEDDTSAEEADHMTLDDPSPDISVKPESLCSNMADEEAEASEHPRVDGYGIDQLYLESNVATEESEHGRTDIATDGRGSPLRLTFRERGSVLRASSVDFGSHVDSLMALSSPQNSSIPGGCLNAEKEGHDFEGKVWVFSSNSSFNSALFHRKMAGKARLLAPQEVRDRLEQAISDAENMKQMAFQESVKRWKAEEDAVDAKNMAGATENKHVKEMEQNKEMEEVLDKQKLECERLKGEHEKFRRELVMVQDQCCGLKSQIRESELTVKELEEKIISAVELLISFRGKRDQLQLERYKAVQEMEILRRLKAQGAATSSGPHFSTFSLMEISEATCSFDPSEKIGDGKYGSIYRGILRHIEVAIRMLPNDGSQGQWRFDHKVEILSRVRHPNIVTLIGICPEARCVVYEYLAKGSLEDHLACRGKNPPLQWQTRVNIMTELCSALIFLHTNNPPIFHGNLKPTKILLDANFVSQIGDLGIFCLIPRNHIPTSKTFSYSENNQHCSSVYIDPEFLETGVLTPHSDVYSFGVILLRLLTGRPALGVVQHVTCALENDELGSVLDFSAGDWPIYQAKVLLQLALRCCERNKLCRPDLASEVWGVLEALRKSGHAQASSFRKKENRRPPSHFLCPIYQEVMMEPCTAADGFTYEGDAIRGWFDNGRKTSPMTNLKLPNCDLIPNHALQYAIQEWLQAR